MDSILVPVTSHVGWARDVARLAIETEAGTETTAIVLYVFDDEEVETTRSNLDLPSDERVTLDGLAARKKGVAVTLDAFEAAGIATEVRGRRAGDDPAGTIVSIADDEPVDRIYLYSRKRSPAGKAVFGSTLQRVLLNTSRPVVVYPPNSPPRSADDHSNSDDSSSSENA